MDLLPSTYSGKDVLITGGLGFIGSHLAKRLVDLGAEVTVVDSLILDYGGNLFNVEEIKDKIQVNIADIRDTHGMNALVRGRDFIFNLAGQVSHVDSMRDAETDLEINCRSQLVLLEACRKQNHGVKIVYAGTRQVYGPPQYLPVDEKHPLHPKDVNGINKIAGEMYHLLFNEVYGIRTVSLRLTNTFGPHQLMKHNRQGFIPWFIRQILDGEEIRLFGDGLQERDMNYIDDAVQAFLLAGATESMNGQVYNLGGERIRLRDFVELLIKVNGGGRYFLIPFPEERKRIDIGSAYCDGTKIEKACGWKPAVSIEAGLRKTLEFYRRNREHYWKSEKARQKNVV